ncbi:bifunctional 2-polyprenyl-6-hydroxyphenol methylase/3-demethylubiquinol 3-O-methyltransferase UbiG [Patulibacter sp.]|uniref:class I SAM-dependent methyltransferase n=1 Tax=Patulibacter sp. TaxID=1912859 RepID=UPI0027182E2C|nr:class I SAM-dependent methyltransferase [Patulibacter sp.]MDO9408794.1 class I SAM-dependent methyltransferase [Patulibacter sp.]
MAEHEGMDGIAAAYEGLETTFADDGALDAYRRSALERHVAQGDVVAALLPPDATVLEIGTGNGRLLIDLARRGLLASALGVDLARSRIAFAEQWATDDGAAGLRFAAGDALTMDLGGAGEWDAAIVITGALAYFDAVAPGSARALLDRLRDGLKPGGRLVLELYPHPSWRQLLDDAEDGRARLWSELPDGDPWRFYLSDLHLDGETGVLTHRKTFVHRTTGEIDEGRREALRLYATDDLVALLHDAGFGEVETFAGWDGAPYDDGELLVVTAVRAD